MNKFIITLKNSETEAEHTQTVEKMCFAEAAQEAYTIKNKLGYSWKITSIKTKGK